MNGPQITKMAQNTFTDGLIMDFNNLVTPSSALTNCLNGTNITFNGNEFMLQNDLGNGRVETAYLPAGYVPVGIKEYGGIIYVASVNPQNGNCQIGSFPSPERNTNPSEMARPWVHVIAENGVKPGVITYKAQALSEDNILHAGDQFLLNLTSIDIDTAKVVVEGCYNLINDTDTWKIKSAKKKAFNIQLMVEDSNHNLIDITDTLTRLYNQAGEEDYVESDNNELSFSLLKKNSGYFLLFGDNAFGEALGNQSPTVDQAIQLNGALYQYYNNKLSGALWLILTINTVSRYEVSYTCENIEDYEVTSTPAIPLKLQNSSSYNDEIYYNGANSINYDGTNLVVTIISNNNNQLFSESGWQVDTGSGSTVDIGERKIHLGLIADNTQYDYQSNDAVSGTLQGNADYGSISFRMSTDSTSQIVYTFTDTNSFTNFSAAQFYVTGINTANQAQNYTIYFGQCILEHAAVVTPKVTGRLYQGALIFEDLQADPTQFTVKVTYSFNLTYQATLSGDYETELVTCERPVNYEDEVYSIDLNVHSATVNEAYNSDLFIDSIWAKFDEFDVDILDSTKVTVTFNQLQVINNSTQETTTYDIVRSGGYDYIYTFSLKEKLVQSTTQDTLKTPELYLVTLTDAQNNVYEDVITTSDPDDNSLTNLVTVSGNQIENLYLKIPITGVYTDGGDFPFAIFIHSYCQGNEDPNVKKILLQIDDPAEVCYIQINLQDLQAGLREYRAEAVPANYFTGQEGSGFWGNIQALQATYDADSDLYYIKNIDDMITTLLDNEQESLSNSVLSEPVEFTVYETRDSAKFHSIATFNFDYYYNCPDGFQTDAVSDDSTYYSIQGKPADFKVPKLEDGQVKKDQDGNIIYDDYSQTLLGTRLRIQVSDDSAISVTSPEKALEDSWDVNLSAVQNETNWVVDIPINHKLSAPVYIRDSKLFHYTQPYTIDITESFLNNVSYSRGELPSVTFEAVPYMDLGVGEVESLKQTGTIDFNLVGSGTIELTRWKYWYSSEELLINWGVGNYLLDTQEISTFKFEFYQIRDGQDFSEADYTYNVPDRALFNGTFTESIGTAELEERSSYIVKIIYDIGGTENTLAFRWVHTTTLFNELYLNSDIIDLGDQYNRNTVNAINELKIIHVDIGGSISTQADVKDYLDDIDKTDLITTLSDPNQTSATVSNKEVTVYQGSSEDPAQNPNYTFTVSYDSPIVIDQDKYPIQGYSISSPTFKSYTVSLTQTNSEEVGADYGNTFTIAASSANTDAETNTTTIQVTTSTDAQVISGVTVTGIKLNTEVSVYERYVDYIEDAYPALSKPMPELNTWGYGNSLGPCYFDCQSTYYYRDPITDTNYSYVSDENDSNNTYRIHKNKYTKFKQFADVQASFHHSFVNDNQLKYYGSHGWPTTTQITEEDLRYNQDFWYAFTGCTDGPECFRFYWSQGEAIYGETYNKANPQVVYFIRTDTEPLNNRNSEIRYIAANTKACYQDHSIKTYIDVLKRFYPTLCNLLICTGTQTINDPIYTYTLSDNSIGKAKYKGILQVNVSAMLPEVHLYLSEDFDANLTPTYDTIFNNCKNASSGENSKISDIPDYIWSQLKINIDSVSQTTISGYQNIYFAGKDLLDNYTTQSTDVNVQIRYSGTFKLVKWDDLTVQHTCDDKGNIDTLSEELNTIGLKVRGTNFYRPVSAGGTLTSVNKSVSKGDTSYGIIKTNVVSSLFGSTINT